MALNVPLTKVLDESPASPPPDRITETAEPKVPLSSAQTAP